MQVFHAKKAEMSDEYGISVGRWTQYPESRQLPFDSMWCVIPPGGQSTPDCHPEVELATVISGSGEFEFQDHTVVVEPGCVLLLESEERHVIHNGSPEEPLVVLSQYWLPETVADRSHEATGV